MTALPRPLPAPFRLRDIEIRPASNEIVVADVVVRLKPRLMAVLLRLAAAPQQVVPRETLLAEVWPRRMVNDDVLSRAIADLRTALSDDAREARFIETIPKVGYRLIAPVMPIAAPDSLVVAPPPEQKDSASTPAALPPPLAAGARARRLRWPYAAAAAGFVAIVLALIWATMRPVPAPAVDRATLERQLAQAEPLASDTALEVSPRFSPDGRHVVYAEGSGPQSRIVVRTLASGERRVLGDPAHLNLAPVFFPDGESIAYYRRDAKGDCAIVAEDLRGGPAAAARRLHAQAAAAIRPRAGRKTPGVRGGDAAAVPGRTARA